LVELAGDQERGLLTDVDGVVAYPLEAARHGELAHAPLERLDVVDVAQDVVENLSVRAVDELVEFVQPACELEIARREGRQRDLHHLDAALTHVDESFHDDTLRAEVARELRELGDRHTLVSDALDVESGVEHGEHEPKVARDGRLTSENELHL